ncbi:hypothetical protein ACCS96_04430 [Rhizobium ruizarguesonis]
MFSVAVGSGAVPDEAQQTLSAAVGLVVALGPCQLIAAGRKRCLCLGDLRCQLRQFVFGRLSIVRWYLELLIDDGFQLGAVALKLVQPVTHMPLNAFDNDGRRTDQTRDIGGATVDIVGDPTETGLCNRLVVQKREEDRAANDGDK